MKYNLTEIFDNPGKTANEELEIELDAILIMGEEYELKDSSPIVMEATGIEQGKARVTCKYSCKVILNCDRCLKPVEHSIDVNADIVVFSPDYTGEEEEACEFMDGYKLDMDEFILSEMLLDWPSKILCREDCKGICTVCGKDLNNGECGCDRFVPNAAFAGLSELFKFDN
ncbi:MAG: DUF177 domain-containing protein [Lachnospiraceae bacterium]|nr:DUF177 domain-containing protein [Candidatus Colinaster scatohippi]